MLEVMPRAAILALTAACGFIASCTLTTPLDELGTGGSTASSPSSGSGAGGSSGAGASGAGTSGGAGGAGGLFIDLVATAANHHRIDLSWNAIGANGTFDVEQDGMVVRPAVSGTSFQSKGLDPSTEYVFRVRPTGGGDWSRPASATTADVPMGAYPEQVLADEPRAYWRMEETSGRVVADATGNVDAGFIGQADPNFAGVLGSGTAFDGVSDSVDLGTVHTAESEWGWSWELWANVASVNEDDSGLLGCGNTPRWTLRLDGTIGGGMLKRSGTGYLGMASMTTLPFGSWHHLVLTVAGAVTDSAVANGYLDGTLIFTTAFSEAIHSPWSRGDGGQTITGDLYLDARDSTFGVQGVYDEVAAYDYVLSAAQIQRHASSQ
jgi:hypothetical protein